MKPKYMMIYDSLTAKLENKEYNFGDMLPSENELCKIYNTSRMTVNKVILMLTQEGKVKRTRGKGTFVIEPNVDKEIVKLTSFSEDMKKIGKEPGSKLLEYRMNFDYSERIRKKLNLVDGDFVHVIKRIRTADGEPIALDIDNISSRVCDKVDIELIKDSLYYYFESVLNVEIKSSDFVIQATTATKEIAEYLNIEIGEPVLYMKHITFTKDDEAFEFCETFYRADKFNLSITAYR